MSDDGRVLALGAVATLLVASAVRHGLMVDAGSTSQGRDDDWPKWAKDDSTILVTTQPPRRFKIIDDHEHVLDEQEALRVLKVMNRFGIKTVVLVGTSKYTLTLSDKYGFDGYKENNEEILRIAHKYPGRFLAFPTIFPPETSNLSLLQDYVARGASGLKLYLGHGSTTGKGPFHMMPLDDPRMKSIYRWAQEVQLPIQYHVNLTKYKAEFERMMEEFPRLRICVPHFGLFKDDPKRLAELGRLFERYPNMYSDIGFGFIDFQIEAFRKFDKFPGRYRDYLTKYADRFMFSSDMVVERGKDDAYIEDSLRSYMQVLEMEWYRFFARPHRLYRGLALTSETLRKIYEETPRRFLRLDRSGSEAVRLTSPTLSAAPCRLEPETNAQLFVAVRTWIYSNLKKIGSEMVGKFFTVRLIDLPGMPVAVDTSKKAQRALAFDRYMLSADPWMGRGPDDYGHSYGHGIGPYNIADSTALKLLIHMDRDPYKFSFGDRVALKSYKKRVYRRIENRTIESDASVHYKLEGRNLYAREEELIRHPHGPRGSTAVRLSSSALSAAPAVRGVTDNAKVFATVRSWLWERLKELEESKSSEWAFVVRPVDLLFVHDRSPQLFAVNREALRELERYTLSATRKGGWFYYTVLRNGQDWDDIPHGSFQVSDNVALAILHVIGCNPYRFAVGQTVARRGPKLIFRRIEQMLVQPDGKVYYKLVGIKDYIAEDVLVERPSNGSLAIQFVDPTEDP